MSKKIMKIPCNEMDPKLHPWPQWPSCKHPKTLSFRANDGAAAVFKTLNSVFIDTSDGIATPDSWFTTSSECTSSFSEEEISNNNNSSNDHDDNGDLSLEAVIRGVRSSDRLFFEPDGTKSILQQEPKTTTMPDAAAAAAADDKIGSSFLPFKESVALTMESEDPYSDFKKSMQEMVESNGLKDWEGLEELLGWYLRMNRKMNHGIIVGAFMDLLIGLLDDSSSSSTNNNRSRRHSDATSYSSADSCFSSPSSPAMSNRRL